MTNSENTIDVILGRFAAIGARWSRSSVNYIPMTFYAVVFGIMLAMGGFSAAAGFPGPGGDPIPGPPLLYGIGGLLRVILTLFFVFAWTRNWVIFCALPTTSSVADSAIVAERVEPNFVNVAVSGRMYLETSRSRCFLLIPARWERRPDGSIAIAAHIDTSVQSSFYFIPTGKEIRQGKWSIAIMPGTVSGISMGVHHLSGWKMPAVRFQYASAFTGRREEAVLTTESTDDRDLLVRFLNAI